MNPLLAGLVLPPKLALRALDDLHTLATTAATAVELLARLDARAERIEKQLDSGIALGHALEQRGMEIAAMGRQLDKLGDALMAEARSTQMVGREIAVRGAEIAAALPLLQRALDLGEPLEGAIERAGRIVDRLPGGRGRHGLGATGSGTGPQKGA
ncbi:MAG: hypothetical protein JWN65_2325 [Solirubrobacterales bacterium]|nr:hypothetical protein [Solirubrobacterales bacterium]